MKPILVRERKTLNTSIGFDSAEYNHFYNPWHYHPEFELTLIIKSYGQRQVGDSIENFEPGDLVLVGQNLPHVWKNDEIFFSGKANMIAQAIVVKFLPDFAGTDFLNRPELTKVRKLLFELAPRGVKPTGNLRKKVEQIMLKMLTMDNTERLIHLLMILDLLSKSKEFKLLASISYRNEKKENTHRLSKVLDFIMENYQENITLEDVASIINMNRNAFCRFFKKGTRKSLFTILNEVRISKACQHLVQTDMNISEVCYANGFNNISSFNKAFKKIIGTSPLRYRKKMKVVTDSFATGI
jgi:AraC-like DNA-binding protein